MASDRIDALEKVGRGVPPSRGRAAARPEVWRLMALLLAFVIAAPLPAAETFAAAEFAPYSKDPYGRTERVEVAVKEGGSAARTYRFRTSMAQRDDAPREREVREAAGFPRVRSGSLLFDGLFALAVDDFRLNSVSEIRDGSYNGGQPIRREVFRTGEKWPYVWTRDVSYAADLSLSVLDPARVVESLTFKSSGFRAGITPPPMLPEDGLQIVQDTGSGGSWPVSTDRVSWALAAERALDNLDGEARAAFAGYAYAVLRGTVEADRLAAFDAFSGLYGGEQSFLDWRAQTYAPWIVDNLAWMSASRALSTNVCHHQALRLAGRLAAEHGHNDLARRYEGWAQELATAIDQRFWLPERGLYASLTNPEPGGATVHTFDMLGLALVTLSGIAPEERARQALANYPHAPFGVPVYYPQQPDTYVYHNRGIWPFVTAYALRAARRLENVAVADHAIRSLVRGAAQNLSNMENFEWLTGKPFFDNGPAINSRRQLWSVAGYLGMVVECFFGYSTENDGVTVSPFLTASARNLLGDSSVAVLDGLRYQGAPITIELELPPPVREDDGFFPVAEVRLNGAAVRGPVSVAQLRRDQPNRFVVTFAAAKAGREGITLVPEVDPSSRRDLRVFSPFVPELEADVKDGCVTLHLFDPGNEPGLVDYQIYRDGERVARVASKGAWRDPRPLELGRSRGYSAEAVFLSSGNRSHHSAPLRIPGALAQDIPVSDSRVRSNRAVTAPSSVFDRPVLESWGRPGDQLVIHDIRIAEAGRYAISVTYNNHAHAINSGVTNAVKRVRLSSPPSGEAWEAEGVIQMPNIEPRGNEHPFRDSSPWVVELSPGTYTLELLDFFNMSYLAANTTYAHNGGASGPMNTAHLAGVRLVALPVGAAPSSATP